MQVNRREFITLVGGASAAWPVRSHAQGTAMIGVLGSENEPHVGAFHKALGESGYVEGGNLTVEYRWSQGDLDRYPALAAELVHRQVAVIAALSGMPAASAAREATAAIPIVFQGGFDPVDTNLVASLSRPGGNVTGITNLGLGLGPKRLEVMHDLVPAGKVFALLINPDHPNAAAQVRDMEAGARSLGLELRPVHARSSSVLDAAFATVAQLQVSGTIVGIGQPLQNHAGQLGALAAHHSIPSIFETREFVAAGGLASYTGDRADAFYRTGLYVARILKGEKPADLPVQQSTKVQLLLNLRSAKSLGLELPATLLARADEVIE